jgi:hypothetical protein
MKSKKWPPKDEVKEVIAYFPEYGWREVRQGYSYTAPQTKEESWRHGLWPMGLPSDGCGCCADTDPKPTHWVPLPEIVQ